MKAYQVLARYALIAALVGLGADQPALAQGRTSAQPTSRPSAPSGELVIYEDALAEGWQNWSWNTQVDFANAQPALGRRSAAVTSEGHTAASPCARRPRLTPSATAGSPSGCTGAARARAA